MNILFSSTHNSLSTKQILVSTYTLCWSIFRDQNFLTWQPKRRNWYIEDLMNHSQKLYFPFLFIRQPNKSAYYKYTLQWTIRTKHVRGRNNKINTNVINRKSIKIATHQLIWSNHRILAAKISTFYSQLKIFSETKETLPDDMWRSICTLTTPRSPKKTQYFYSQKFHFPLAILTSQTDLIIPH